jgi:replicative DNA helicase
MARAGERVLFFSLEQANIELMDRLLSSVARVDGAMIRAGNISREEAAKLFAAAGEIETWPIYLEDKPAITMSEITAIARRLHRQEPLSVIMIDYIQLIEAADKKMPREQQVATISRNLKFLAKELGIPVIVLAQLNRDVEKRTTKRPMLADLRESGSIEQDADMVLFLNRPDAYDAQDQPGVAEVIIAKNRAGPCGIVTLTWRKELMRFEDCSFYGGGL